MLKYKSLDDYYENDAWNKSARKCVEEKMSEEQKSLAR